MHNSNYIYNSRVNTDITSVDSSLTQLLYKYAVEFSGAGKMRPSEISRARGEPRASRSSKLPEAAAASPGTGVAGFGKVTAAAWRGGRGATNPPEPQKEPLKVALVEDTWEEAPLAPCGARRCRAGAMAGLSARSVQRPAAPAAPRAPLL